MLRYLGDVGYSSHELQLKTEHEDTVWLSEGWPSLRAKFRESSWFTRGWTLQELLAPEKTKISFFDENWIEIGSLPQLTSDVAEITGVEKSFLGFKVFGASTYVTVTLKPSIHASIAKRMSWVSRRQTSREEDMAYCLLGLFDVNMALLYGEGAERAFYRLQIEIMRKDDDESLFAWTSNQEISGMLAASPSFFTHSGNINRNMGSAGGPYAMTNKGLEFPIPKQHIAPEATTDPFIVFLDCFRDGEEKVPLALHLQRKGKIGIYRRECNKLQAANLLSDFKDWTLDDLHKDLRDTHYIYVADCHERLLQQRVFLNNREHILEITGHERRLLDIYGQRDL